MIIKAAVTGLLVIAALAGCSTAEPGSADDSAKIMAAVKAEFAALVTSLNRHDAAGVVAHDEPGYIGMFHGAPNTVGSAANLVGTTRQLADPAAKVTILDQVIDVAASGELAIDRATYEYVYTDPAGRGTKTESGNWVLAFKKQPDRTWKLAWSIVADTGPAHRPE